MPTPQQNAANRQNAQSSTAPVLRNAHTPLVTFPRHISEILHLGRKILDTTRILEQI